MGISRTDNLELRNKKLTSSRTANKVNRKIRIKMVWGPHKNAQSPVKKVWKAKRHEIRNRDTSILI